MQTFFFKTVLATALALSATASFATTNLVTNGSFENSLNGWTQTGTPAPGVSVGSSINPISVITYGSTTPYPGGSAYGEAIPVDTISNASVNTDVAGTKAAYFVDDHAVNQGINQYVFLAAGNYQIGFDVYIPNNGQSNPGPASFSANIANVQLANFSVGSSLTGQWYTVAGTATVASSNNYNISFLYNSGIAAVNQTAKDVVIDRVYVTAGGAGGRVLPEPGMLALFGIAGAGMTLSRRRRKG